MREKVNAHLSIDLLLRYQPLFTFVLSFLFIFTFMRLYLYLNLWEKTFLYLGGHGQCSIFYWFVVALINLCCGSPPRIGQMYCALFYWFLHKIPPRIGQMYLCIIGFYWFLHKMPWSHQNIDSTIWRFPLYWFCITPTLYWYCYWWDIVWLVFSSMPRKPKCPNLSVLTFFFLLSFPSFLLYCQQTIRGAIGLNEKIQSYQIVLKRILYTDGADIVW